MKNLRFREEKTLAQGHTALAWDAPESPDQTFPIGDLDPTGLVKQVRAELSGP